MQLNTPPGRRQHAISDGLDTAWRCAGLSDDDGEDPAALDAVLRAFEGERLRADW